MQKKRQHVQHGAGGGSGKRGLYDVIRLLISTWTPHVDSRGWLLFDLLIWMI